MPDPSPVHHSFSRRFRILMLEFLGLGSGLGGEHRVGDPYPPLGSQPSCVKWFQVKGVWHGALWPHQREYKVHSSRRVMFGGFRTRRLQGGDTDAIVGSQQPPGGGGHGILVWVTINHYCCGVFCTMHVVTHCPQVGKDEIFLPQICIGYIPYQIVCMPCIYPYIYHIYIRCQQVGKYFSYRRFCGC